MSVTNPPSSAGEAASATATTAKAAASASATQQILRRSVQAAFDGRDHTFLHNWSD